MEGVEAQRAGETQNLSAQLSSEVHGKFDLLL